ncbi:hypothetical protein DL96DRAFT_1701954 [Flagelloscypha sp. PMI_526]|nr:hypothetical protein DL96DRAFT_1701954 [Flagelloscypha sp. PMI_526]
MDNFLPDLFELLFLSCDKPTIATACCISRSLLPIARRALYTRITLNHDRAWLFLADARRHLHMVEHLTLVHLNRDSHYESVWPSFLAAVEKDRPALRSLTLTASRFVSQGTANTTILKKLLNLPSLSYVSVTTDLLPLRAILACPALEELIINAPDIDRAAEVQFSRESRPFLSTLVIDQGAKDWSFAQLDRYLQWRNLTKLALRLPPTHNDVFFDILKATSDSLTHFSFECEHGKDEFVSQLAKIVLPKLRVLCMFCSVLYHQTWWGCILPILSAILPNAPHLHELHIYLDLTITTSLLEKSRRNTLKDLSPQIRTLHTYVMPLGSSLDDDLADIIRTAFGGDDRDLYLTKGGEFAYIVEFYWGELWPFCKRDLFWEDLADYSGYQNPRRDHHA